MNNYISDFYHLTSTVNSVNFIVIEWFFINCGQRLSYTIHPRLANHFQNDPDLSNLSHLSSQIEKSNLERYWSTFSNRKWPTNHLLSSINEPKVENQYSIKVNCDEYRWFSIHMAHLQSSLQFIIISSILSKILTLDCPQSISD